MADKEEGDEFEVISMSPVRRLEKRIDDLERGREHIKLEYLVKEILDLVKSNQSLVDEVIKADAKLRLELEKLPTKIDDMLAAWKEFVGALKEASGVSSEESPKAPDVLADSMGDILKTNREILVTLESIRRGLKAERPPGERQYPKIRIRPREEQQV